MKITIDHKNICKAEIDTIVIFLKKKMKQDTDGYYWDTIHYDNSSNQFSYKFNNSIWNGTPGIILFFISLYAYSEKDEYLHIAKKATKKCLKMQERNPTKNTSLFDGVSGLLYVCIKLFKYSADHLYLNNAEKLAIKYKSQITIESKDDILGGKAGNLYALTLLYHYTQNVNFLEDIRALILNLATTAGLKQQGVGWGVDTLSVDALCGFSHGASGIGHILLQVGIYFNEPDLIWLAEQAFFYEKEYYSPEINNWMDLRWVSANEHLSRLFEWDKETFMPTNFDVNAWAHGAAGIGIARLYAQQFTTKSDEFNMEINAILKRCIYDVKYETKKSYLLFSGYGGLAEFFILYSQFFNNDEIYQQAVKIALNAVTHSRLHGHDTWGIQGQEDLGLMTGTAGIGFLLLRTVDNGHFDSILHPTLPNKFKPEKLGFTDPYPIRKIIYSRYFNKSIAFLNSHTKLSNNIFNTGSIAEFAELLKTKITTVNPAEKNYGNDLLRLENLTTELWKEHKGRLCFQIRLKLLKNELERYKDEAIFCHQKFIINPFVKISQYHWNTPKDTAVEKFNEHWTILYSSDDQIHQFTISKFPATILSYLQEPLSIEEITDKLSQEFGLHKILTKEKVILQIKELLTQYLIRGISPINQKKTA